MGTQRAGGNGKEKDGSYRRLTHGFGPVYDANSRVLILGSFPSVKSREQQFYYGHPQNRFWKVLSALTGEELPRTVEEKRALALAHGIALWDVIDECDIVGSSDSSIRNVKVNDIRLITDRAPIQRILLNGNKAYQLYVKYMAEQTGLPAAGLPSTSPANAACSLERLTAEWGGALHGDCRGTERDGRKR